MRRVSRLALAAFVCSCLLWFGADRRAHAMTCTVIGTSDLAFGTYTSSTRRPLDAVTFFAFTCNGVQIHDVVAIQISRSQDGGMLPRHMLGVDDAFEYNLYLNAGRSQVWGDGSMGTFAPQLHPQDGRTMSLPIYARAAPGQHVRPGTYADTVIVSLIF
jgi:spore coat protein U-like protein